MDVNRASRQALYTYKVVGRFSTFPSSLKQRERDIYNRVRFLIPILAFCRSNLIPCFACGLGMVARSIQPRPQPNPDESPPPPRLHPHRLRPSRLLFHHHHHLALASSPPSSGLLPLPPGRYSTLLLCRPPSETPPVITSPARRPRRRAVPFRPGNPSIMVLYHSSYRFTVQHLLIPSAVSLPMIDSPGKGPSFLQSILMRDSNFADQLSGCSPCPANLQVLIRDPAAVGLGLAANGPNCHPALLVVPSPADSAVRGG